MIKSKKNFIAIYFKYVSYQISVLHYEISGLDKRYNQTIIEIDILENGFFDLPVVNKINVIKNISNYNYHNRLKINILKTRNESLLRVITSKKAMLSSLLILKNRLEQL